MLRPERIARRVKWITLLGLGVGACTPEDDAERLNDPSPVDTTIAGDKAQPSLALVFDARTEPAGANCPAGGVALLSGQDQNRNGVLDAGEVTTTRYVCNGVTGATGQDGEDGFTSIITTRDEPIGTACPTGGKAFSIGLDSDRNGVLDPAEVTSTEYVCNGLNGADGSDGEDGKNSLVVVIPQDVGSEHCADGGQGIYTGLDLDGNGVLAPGEVQNTVFVCNGSDGASGLVNQSTESPGPNCEYGGTRIDSGLDVDGDGTLDADEVTQTSYACNGAPGEPGPIGPEGPSGLNSLVDTASEPPGTNCTTGGVALKIGLDLDADGVLDPEEVQATSYVCNGNDGSGPTPGGELAVRSTVTILDETELPPWGGKVIELWVDATGDDSMQPEEVFHSIGIPILAVRQHASCAEGEIGWQLGLDSNLDGVLQVSEIQTERCLPGYVGIDAGDVHTCGLVFDGSVRCWGYNSQGQLGNGAPISWISSIPIAVPDLSGVASISVGFYHTCVVLTDGTARCWGYNGVGQLGDGSGTNSSTPVTVDGLSGVASISAGAYHTCAVLTDGSARCWGYNFYGQLGDGTNTDSPTPIAVPGLSGVASISAGGFHTCAVLSDATTRCWGYNSAGQLGDGSVTNSSTPVTVSDLSGVASISSGTVHTCGVLTDGGASCWGYGVHGQLGNGSTDSSFTPSSVLDP